MNVTLGGETVRLDLIGTWERYTVFHNAARSQAHYVTGLLRFLGEIGLPDLSGARAIRFVNQLTALVDRVKAEDGLGDCWPF